jgi:hypothetical protein
MDLALLQSYLASASRKKQKRFAKLHPDQWETELQMFVLEDERTDRTKYEDGIWVLYKGVELKIAAAGNSRYNKALMALPPGIRTQLTNGELPIEEERKVLSSLRAKANLLDWKGMRFTRDQDDDTPYSMEAARDAMLISQELFNFVGTVSGEYKAYRVVAEDIEGNYSKMLSERDFGFQVE